jgi:hypothetical protein
MTARQSQAILARLMALAVLAPCVACTYVTSTTNSAPGAMTMRFPGTLPPVASPPQSPGAPPPDGRFEGTATLSSNFGHGCRQQVPVRNFVVSGNTVRAQGFRGRIQPDSFVQLQSGDRFIYGYFDGGRFVGHFWQGHPDCTYDLVLNHVG